MSCAPPESDRSLLALARAISQRRGGREALEKLAQLEPGDVALSSLLLPMHAGTLLFLRPERFADRASVRRFVAGEPFAAWIAVVQQVVIGGVGVPAASGPMPGSVLERAQITAHALLGDLELLARVAAEQTGGPIAFTAAESAPEPRERIAQWAALARVAASLAAEGAAPECWQPIFDALDEALAPELGS